MTTPGAPIPTVLEGHCHCGEVHWRFSVQAEGATACNCTLCRRYGVLWIYDYEGIGVTLAGNTTIYGPGAAIDFLFCARCHCIAAWRARAPGADGRRRMAVNVRLCEPDTVAHIPIDHFDGLERFEDLPRDGRCVADYWF